MSEERTYGPEKQSIFNMQRFGIEPENQFDVVLDMISHIREMQAQLARSEAWAAELEREALINSLSWYDVERLTKALSWQGCSTPESQEECCARWKELTRDLINSVLEDKARKTCGSRRRWSTRVR